MRSRGALAAVALALVAPTPAHAVVEPYGTNDAGGFRNILPPGSNGLDNALGLAQFQATGARPAHSDDQLAPYVNLLYASPTLTDAQLPTYFKDATFGAKDAASTEQPRPGVTIVRDAAFGVPHVYGVTRGDVAFGAGYAGAEDRLFLMDVLRHTGRAELASFAGGDPSNREQDREQWVVAPYTEADLQKQIDQAPKLYGARGQQTIDDLIQYVAGINAYISAARLDPTKMPGEYALLGQQLRDWTPTDVIATASLIGGIYGKGGGEELKSALVLQAAIDRYGAAEGRRVWSQLRMIDDPEAPTTLRTRFPYETGVSPFAKRDLALPDPGSVRHAKLEQAIGRSQVGGLLPVRGASNVLLVRAASAEHGRPIAVMGPEVGFYAPQILLEEDLHGPGFDARGAAFPGVNLYVQLGHGRDFAWSATSAYGDNVDTFALPLCDADHYRYHGACRAFETLTRHESWTPNVADSTPAGSLDLVAQRTALGLVEARATIKGKPVVYVRRRSTYGHEADSGIAFAMLNDPAQVHSPQTFMRAAAMINLSFNWFYVDRSHIAYFGSGAYPRRPVGTSPDFPLAAAAASRGLIGDTRHPHAVDPPYLVNWNNRPAPRFAGADDDWGESSPDRSQLLSEKVAAGTAGGRRMTAAELVSAMEETATQDLRGAKLVALLARAVGAPPNHPELGAAMALLRGWAQRGAHRRDLNKDGHYDDDAAVTLMDAWWPRLVDAEFHPGMGEALWKAMQTVKPVGDTKGGPAETPEFCCSWYPYVSKDLRATFGPRRPPRWPHAFCAGGAPGGCRAIMRQTLAAALRVTRADLYGHDPDCASRGQVEASCHDEERPTTVGGIDAESFPFAQRPTFQQLVQVGGD